MLYHWESTAALSAVRDAKPAAPRALTGEGLGVCLLCGGERSGFYTRRGFAGAGSLGRYHQT